ncbi:hypothetical protein HYY75_11740, partial [bacterium]|nr:hypothetical protein [bacterium]
ACVSLNGNIELDLSRFGSIEALLIAMKGRIINSTPTRPLDLRGGIIVGELLPESFRAGGRVAYDTRFDPSGFDYPNYYRAYVSDIPSTVEDNS